MPDILDENWDWEQQNNIVNQQVGDVMTVIGIIYLLFSVFVIYLISKTFKTK